MAILPTAYMVATYSAPTPEDWSPSHSCTISHVKLVVAGKGGVGKTMIAGTLARALARSGHKVLAIDCDPNPMLGISLGLGADRTEDLLSARERLATGHADHQPTAAGMVDAFGTDAPDGVRLVVAARVEHVDPG